MPSELQPPERPFICESIKSDRMNHIIECCSNRSFCNDMDIQTTRFLGPRRDHFFGGGLHWYILLLMVVAVTFSAFGLLVGIFWFSSDRSKQFIRRWLLRLTHGEGKLLDDDGRPLIFNKERTRLDALLDDLETANSSGSGAGMPILAQRTIARQITLKDCIGRGRFGEVFVGEWRGEKVAVKIFLSRDEQSWHRETEIFRTNMLRHSNLLRWIASDNKDTGASTQLWLVTEFLPHGSLCEYLERHSVSTPLGLQFIRSIAHGLAYLHAEVPGVNNQCFKPGIAHRDIKSRNILIKNDMTCAIADLGLAVRCFNGNIDIPENSRGGTVRYLAPEYLDGTLVPSRFTTYIQMDIYAYALVIWEIARRMEYSLVSMGAQSYEVPYFEFVPREPTTDEMRQCVVTDGQRPTMPPDWEHSTTMLELTRIMSESWSENPNSRLTALNIRYSLDKLVKQEGLRIVV
ncbi:DAF-1 protein [Aphelenchoides avenae]|nr:DAF-1 protein [Aphelenchus avenae]KAH7730973.1 DAF-1 protein [Aphelenchus avenae]